MRMWKSYEARRLECTARSAPITPVTRRPRESACGVGRAAPADVCAVAGWSRPGGGRALSIVFQIYVHHRVRL